MPESPTPTPGPARRAVAAALDTIFLILLSGMLVVGALIVLVQAAGLLVGREAWVVDLGGGPLTAVACACAGLLGFTSLLQARAHGWRPTD